MDENEIQGFHSIHFLTYMKSLIVPYSSGILSISLSQRAFCVAVAFSA